MLGKTHTDPARAILFSEELGVSSSDGDCVLCLVNRDHFSESNSDEPAILNFLGIGFISGELMLILCLPTIFDLELDEKV
jgi:hypothetical protein